MDMMIELLVMCWLVEFVLNMVDVDSCIVEVIWLVGVCVCCVIFFGEFYDEELSFDLVYVWFDWLNVGVLFLKVYEFDMFDVVIGLVVLGLVWIENGCGIVLVWISECVDVELIWCDIQVGYIWVVLIGYQVYCFEVLKFEVV